MRASEIKNKNDNNMARIQRAKKSHWIKERIKMLSVGAWYTAVINKNRGKMCVTKINGVFFFFWRSNNDY